MFKNHLSKMNALVAQHLGDAMQFLHGAQSWPVNPVPDNGEASFRLQRSARSLAGVNKTIELSIADMPPVPWRELRVSDGVSVFQIVDRDVDDDWVRLYLVPVGDAPVDQSNSDAFLF